MRGEIGNRSNQIPCIFIQFNPMDTDGSLETRVQTDNESTNLNRDVPPICLKRLLRSCSECLEVQLNTGSYTMKTGFRIFGSRNNDKKGVYTTWIVLSWNGDLIYFMYTFMK